MVLNGPEVRSRLIVGPNLATARGWWEDRAWEVIRDRLLIHDFSQARLRPGGYDLAVGHECLSLWHLEETPRQVLAGNTIRISPGETVLVLSKEFVALPPTVRAEVIPRALLSAQGLLIAPQHLEPTWFGRLVIACLNHSSDDILLAPDLPLCTCVFEECDGDQPNPLPLDGPGLGREHLAPFHSPQRLRRNPLRPEEVTPERLAQIAAEYGYPWDAVSALTDRLRKELKDYCSTDLFHKVAEDLKSYVDDKMMGDYRRIIYVMVSLAGIVAGAVATYYLKGG